MPSLWPGSDYQAKNFKCTTGMVPWLVLFINLMGFQIITETIF